MAFRSWAARILFIFSGWEDRDGGERRRLRGGEEPPAVFVGTGAKPEVSSIAMAGAIAFAVTCSLLARKNTDVVFRKDGGRS